MSRHSSNVEKNTSKKTKKAREKKASLNFIGASQHSKQTYIGNFVYLLVTLNTFHNPLVPKGKALRTLIG